MRKKKIGFFVGLVALVVLGMITLGFRSAISNVEPRSAKDTKATGWWDEDWQYRRAPYR